MQVALGKIKGLFEDAITTARFNGSVYANGNKAKEALIRSQKIISYIHESVKGDLVLNGVNALKIYPPVQSSSPELKIKGFLKSKNQDIAVVPSNQLIQHAKNGTSSEVEKILSINIRSQLSSLNKNIDTLFERTFAEALNLHLLYPRQCLGEVYLIPTHEYDDKAMIQNRVVFKKVTKIEDYIKKFQSINNRLDITKDEYKYERVCLLIVDFRQSPPKVYSTVDELKNDALVDVDSAVDLSGLSMDTFVSDLLSIYEERFGSLLKTTEG
jgi:hypothetical protein